MTKELQRNRVMLDFINASDELIFDEGLENITLRKVAQKAGYNSATLYNYFENLDHLIFFSAMRFVKDYSLALEAYIKDAKNAMDRFLMVWECFNDYAFDKPEIYKAIFFPDLQNRIEDYVEVYYKLFPEDLMRSDFVITTMLLKTDINDRAMTTVNDCINEGFIRKEDGETLNELTLLIFEGVLKKVISGKTNYEDARNKTMDYFKPIVKGLLIKDYDFYY
ncbi:MAG: TetR/AcrR family transcriptional regulator [Gudongella sp.]|nr:TetR/AcrR family transcriptional regulator [Gudongella sp.]